MLPEKFANYLRALVAGKKVAILGYGREGQSTLRILRQIQPDLKLTVIDQASSLDPQLDSQLKSNGNVEVFLGIHSLSKLVEFDLIFKSPGVSPFLLEIQDAIGRGTLVTSQTDIFFAVFGHQTIAITGTKGKSTASQAMHQVLTKLGKSTLFIGNIGLPAFDSLNEIEADSVVVYETSSHQAEGLNHSPHIGVLLNLFADHLDYYPSLDLYGEAKKKLFAFQTREDLCLFRCDDQRVTRLVSDVRSTKIGFSLEHSEQASVYLDSGWIMLRDQKLILASDIPLIGTHNLVNVMPAILVADFLGFEVGEIADALKVITPVKNRLETVATVAGIRFVDDALATIPEATIAAIEAFDGEVETLIVGGFDRGQDFSALAQKITASSIRHLILFPTTGEKIAKLLQDAGAIVSLHRVSDMKAAVAVAFENTTEGKVVLLSTASASFGVFKDYRDRSEQYYQAIMSYRQ